MIPLDAPVKGTHATSTHSISDTFLEDEWMLLLSYSVILIGFNVDVNICCSMTE